MAYILKRPLYLTEDKNTVVEEGDPLARFVLGGAGSEIPDEEAERLGLTGSKMKVGPKENKAQVVISKK